MSLFDGAFSRRVSSSSLVNMSTVGYPEDLEDAASVAKYINDVYFAYDPSDDSSSIGVPMVMNNRVKVYCGPQQCFRGWADCRMSGSLYNHLVQLDQQHNSIRTTMMRPTGFILNPKYVEKTFLKCAYMFDGAATYRLNSGCGCQTSLRRCGSGSAHANECGADKHRCSAEDAEVKQCSCDASEIPQSFTEQQCFFKGPAFMKDHVDQKNNQMRLMLKERLARQGMSTQHVSQKSMWNEIIIDTELLRDQLRADPNDIILAFVYMQGHGMGDERVLELTEKMRTHFTAQYGVTRTIPILKIDTKADVSTTNQIFLPN